MSSDSKVADPLEQWLNDVGLGQYYPAMAAEDLTFDDLKDLDDADLKELGLSIGHRKALRRAIETAAPTPVDEPGQRRQLTVLFCDLAQSTKMAQTYDAEDMAQILHSYHDRCYEIVKRWGGRPLGTQGDGVIACFGLPQAQENDAERCVRAALEMSQAISELTFEDGLKLHSRIGVATGRLYVRGAVEEPGNVVGDTLNLASRLQDLAAYDTVVLSAATQRLVEKVTRLTPMGDHQLKGFQDTVEVWTVDGVFDIADRLSAEERGQTKQLFGRESELATLRGLWELAKEGQGQVAVISGDAGIGKSQVLDALRAHAAPDDPVQIRYFSAPFYENSALFPIIAQLKHAVGIGESTPAEDRLARLSTLAPDGDAKAIRIFADLLSVDPGEAYPPLDMTAAQQKQETFAALARQLLINSEAGPVLILAEDAHWADPTSLEFLTMIVGQVVPGNRVLLVVTHRPNVDLAWEAQPHIHPINLGRLSAEESREIVVRVMGDTPFPAELMHDIVENADGVPLFVEELSRSVAEQIARDGLGQVRLPSSLEDSLRERLDRLSKGKNVIQTAAVFGRRFYLSLLQPILSMNKSQLAAAVEEPVEANIVMPLEESTTEAMIFHHALVQQAAYEGLLRKQRGELHARIADLLLEHQPEITQTEPETLARHFAGSGQWPKAIEFLVAAGQRATSRAAQVEATNHYLAALEYLKELPASPERDGQEVLLQALLGGALMATRGFAAPDVYDAFARARALCVELGDHPMYCASLYGLFTVNASRANKDEAVALAQEMLENFGEAPVLSWAIAAHFAAGVADFFQGNMDQAKAYFEKAVALYSDDQHAPLVEQFGDNLAEFSICYLQWLHLQRGDVDAASSYLARASAMADELNNKNAQTRTFSFRMGRLAELEDYDGVAELAPQVIDISLKQGYPYWATAGQIGLGWVTACRGDANGIAMIEAGLAFLDMIGQKTPQTYWRSYLVDGLVKLGRADEAVAAADYALSQAEGGLDRFYEPQILRVKGEALSRLGDQSAARQCFEDALERAEAGGLHLHILAATLKLAEMRAEQGEAQAAVPAVQDAIDKVTSTEDFAVLSRAKAFVADWEE